MPDETPPISPERALFNGASFFEKCLAKIHDRNARAEFDGEVTDPEEKMEAEILQDELEEKFADKMDSLYKSLSHGFASSNSPSAPILLTALQEQFRKPFDAKTWSKGFILAPIGLGHGDENYIPTHNQFLREIEIFLPDSQSKATVSGPPSFTPEAIAAAVGKSMAGVESRLDATIKAADRIADGTRVVAKNVRAMSESVKNIDAGIGAATIDLKAVVKNTESISSNVKTIAADTKSINVNVGAVAADVKVANETTQVISSEIKGVGSGIVEFSKRIEIGKTEPELPKKSKYAVTPDATPEEILAMAVHYAKETGEKSGRAIAEAIGVTESNLRFHRDNIPKKYKPTHSAYQDALFLIELTKKKGGDAQKHAKGGDALHEGSDKTEPWQQSDVEDAAQELAKLTKAMIAGKTGAKDKLEAMYKEFKEDSDWSAIKARSKEILEE